MNLSSREKHLVLIVSAAIGLLVAYQFWLRPMMEDAHTLRRVVPEKREELSRLKQLAEEYERISIEIEELGGEVPEPETGFSPLAFIENALEQAGITPQSLSPREIRGERVVQVTIDVSIAQASWTQLLDFFAHLNASETPLRLSSFDIRRRRRGDGLEADVTVTGLRRAD